MQQWKASAIVQLNMLYPFSKNDECVKDVLSTCGCLRMSIITCKSWPM